ncbi:MAG: hypothetical protein JZU50_03750 [Desulfobulbaceae bacterium]|nr:hypothetical protein [Desulfobulbaceae bacterium]
MENLTSKNTETIQNIETSLLDHVDNLTAIIERTEAITRIVSRDLLSTPEGAAHRRLSDSDAASLIWQAQENLQAMRRTVNQMWDDYMGEVEMLRTTEA